MHPLRVILARTYLETYLERKVLHIDRNSFYGGEGASVNLTNLWKLFKGEELPPKELGHNRDWNIDLIPKYIMSGGKLVKILLKTRVSRYLEWKRKKYLIQQLMALLSFKIKKVDSSQKGASKWQKFQLPLKKLSHQNLWDCLRKIGSESSWKLCRILSRETKKLMEELPLKNQLKLCLRNSVSRKTQLILLAMLLPSTLMKVSWKDQPLK